MGSKRLRPVGRTYIFQPRHARTRVFTIMTLVIRLDNAIAFKECRDAFGRQILKASLLTYMRFETHMIRREAVKHIRMTLKSAAAKILF